MTLGGVCSSAIPPPRINWATQKQQTANMKSQRNAAVNVLAFIVLSQGSAALELHFNIQYKDISGLYSFLLFIG